MMFGLGFWVFGEIAEMGLNEIDCDEAGTHLRENRADFIHFLGASLTTT